MGAIAERLRAGGIIGAGGLALVLALTGQPVLADEDGGDEGGDKRDQGDLVFVDPVRDDEGGDVGDDKRDQGGASGMGRLLKRPLVLPKNIFETHAIGFTDFGGGKQFGDVLVASYGVSPKIDAGFRFGAARSFDAFNPGAYHTGAFTSRFEPYYFDEGRGRITFHGQGNSVFIDLDNGNPTEDNSQFATNGASVSNVGVSLGYIPGDYRVPFSRLEDSFVGANLSASWAFSRTDLKNDFSNDAGCDSKDLNQTVCLYDANVFFGSKDLGKVTIGLGETAFNGLGDINWGGIVYVVNSDPNVLGGRIEVWGLGRRLDEVVPDTAGVQRGTGVLVETRTIAGFKLSASAGEASHTDAPADADQYWDAALRYAGEFGAIRVAAGIGYQDHERDGPNNRSEQNFTAAASVQHVPTGVYLTVSGSSIGRSSDAALTGAEDDRASALYMQGGISQNFFGIGNTTIYGEYSQTNGGATSGNHFVANSDSETVGFGLVQAIDPWSTSVYISYQHIETSVSGTSGQDIDIVMGGARTRY